MLNRTEQVEILQLSMLSLYFTTLSVIKIWNGGMTNWKKLEGNGCFQIEILSGHAPGGKGNNHENLSE
jgi:hypothetical protein